MVGVPDPPPPEGTPGPVGVTKGWVRETFPLAVGTAGCDPVPTGSDALPGAPGVRVPGSDIVPGPPGGMVPGIDVAPVPGGLVAGGDPVAVPSPVAGGDPVAVPTAVPEAEERAAVTVFSGGAAINPEEKAALARPADLKSSGSEASP